MQAHWNDTFTGLRRVFEQPADERPAAMRSLLEPLRPFFRMPGRPEPGDLLEIAATFGFPSPSEDPAPYIAQLDALEAAGIPAQCAQACADAIAPLQPAARDLRGTIAADVMLSSLAGAQNLERGGGYTGFGGQSGHALVLVAPNAFNTPRIAAALAHEIHHNVRLRYEPWNAQTTVGQYIVIEGLAEAFAAELYGDDKVGPWVTTLRADEKPAARAIIGGALDVSGWNEIRAYIFGDWAAEMFGFTPRGLPYCAGYAVGFEVVRAYCANTGSSVADATYVPWRAIVEASQVF